MKSYISAVAATPAEFARRLDYDRGNFHRLLNDPEAWPSLDLAHKIECETGGQVSMALWAEAKAAAEQARAA